MIRSWCCLLAAQAIVAQPVTFNKQIAPLMFKNCSPCHRPGEGAPFALLTYRDVAQHGRQIVTVTRSRFMPPWLPDPNAHKFTGERRLSDAEIRMIERWVSEGEIEGRVEDLPPTPKFTDGWQLGQPDLVLTLSRAYTLAPGGADVYRNFVFKVPLDSMRYIRALEIRPGNKRVVHHANLLIDRNRSSRWRDGRDGQPGFAGMDLKIEANLGDPESHFLFWKPGSVATDEPEGMAWTLEPGTDLVLNMHLQPAGKPESIRPSLGLYFTRTAPRLKPLLVQLENDRALDIPPHSKDFVVNDDLTLPVDADLLAVYPHAHYLGRDVEGVATLPGGKQQTLVRIRHWDLNWQGVFRYETPWFLPKGTTISMRWIYDNATGKRITAGDQATDEMSHFWLQLLPRGPGDQRMVIQEALLRKRLQRDPADFTAHFNLAGVLNGRGDRDGAVRELRQAVAARPADEVALNTLAALLQLENKLDEAQVLYGRALESRPDYADAHYNLASLLMARDAPGQAIPHLRDVLKLQPDDVKAPAMLVEALESRAKALVRAGKMTEATTDFREIVSLKPADSDASTNLGVALAMQGQYREAKRELERALALNADNAVARKNLIHVQELLK